MNTDKFSNVSDYYYDVFISISEVITGFTINDLRATGLGEVYYTHILNSIERVTFLEFLNRSQKILEATFTSDELKNAIRKDLLIPPEMKPILDGIITIWYLGKWDGVYVNSLSYKEGLVWKIISSHPAGAKQPGFASWSFKPLTT